MDDSAVQTALCVIGHPIAGNPSQFCILRALTALGLEWQCLSFDVPVESLPAAVSGIDVLGFAGALISAPHHVAVAALLQPPAAEPALPSPAPPSWALPDTPPTWIDGLQRGDDDRWVGCNFLGEAFAELLASHQRKLTQPLPHCVFLGSAETFATAVAPYQQHLPSSCFVLDHSGLRRLPVGNDSAPQSATAANEQSSASSSPLTAALEEPSSLPHAETTEPPKTEPPPAPSGSEAVAESATPEGVPDTTLNPLAGPVLLLHPHCQGTHTKKGTSKHKTSSQLDSLLESTLQQLHPDSLLVNLAPEGAPWQVIRGQASTLSAVVSPLDLEVNRIAIAIRRWTGHDPDRTLLAEAIEEYLEI